MPFLGMFGLEFLKNIVIFEISTLKFVISKSVTHTMKFGLGSAFSKSLGSAFSEGPGLGPGLLYKVCCKDPVSWPFFKNVSNYPTFYMGKNKKVKFWLEKQVHFNWKRYNIVLWRRVLLVSRHFELIFKSLFSVSCKIYCQK